ncbi:MAG TPA: response regulator [Kofleriaceae bacterium]|nr:response regulator [Kofleriaceae bacterium]
MTRKIMVVDDNPATRRMVRNALVHSGHEVIEAPDGKTARALMKAEQPRVVLQDLMLPDADGFELVGELRRIARGTDVSILAFSGFVSEADEARISTVGFDDIITKPVAPSRLVPLIEAHLPEPATPDPQFGKGRRLVIADDDPMQLKLAMFRLARLGFEVEGVPDGRAALEAVRRRTPDVVISDVMMPELDGFGLAMAVRQDPVLRKVPVLLVTSSYVDPADRELARRAGANDLLARTPELGELLDRLRTTLSSRHDAPLLDARVIDDLEKEHGRRVFRQLERQVMLNTGLAKRCSGLASELAVLAGISDAVLNQSNVDAALDSSLTECFDAGGIAQGALYLLDAAGALRARTIGTGVDPAALATLFGHERLLRELITSRRTVHLPSGGLGRELERELLEGAQASAIMVVPLHTASGALGCLLMIARSRELEQEDWRAFGHGIATQIGHVLTLARAYEDRAMAERRATEHAALLDALFESAPDYVAHLDLDGTIRLMNRPLFEHPATGVVGTNIFSYPAGDHAIALRKALAQVEHTGQPQGFEASVFRPDGSQVWYSTRLGPVKENGKVTGAVLVSRDVSDKKQTEMHLMLSDRMASVGTLAAGVAHEINNPLASVIANLDMALQDLVALSEASRLPPELSDELMDARAAADRVREIVRDLKIFSRGDEDRHGPVDVEHVLESTLRMAWNELRHRARVVRQYAQVPLVEADESRLGQVFLNLIINAAHAIPAGNHDANEVRISTSVDANGRVTVDIADTGTGIAPEVQPRLFTPFFSTKPIGVGTGLGLAISHRIITQLGGTIGFDSELGKGTTFHITLPVAGETTAPVHPQKAWTRTPAARRGSVLVVDDEESLAQALRRYLGGEHDVTAVYRARDALDLLELGTRYDVILCDLMMPQITGMELHAEVVRIDPAQAARFVFLTGGAFTPAAREFLLGSPNHRIEKPFDLKDVRRLVNELIH